MEITQFVSYLDYGVLGLSAIILILSFVLLSREQKREEFRPEVAKAIRRYMMLALAFAGIGLVSTIVDGVMVRPSKKEKQEQEKRMDLLSDMISKEMEKKMLVPSSDTGVKSVEPLIETNIDGTMDSVTIEGDEVIPDSIVEYNNMKKTVFLSIHDFGADKALLSESLDKLEEEHTEVKRSKEKILKDYNELANLKEKWLEEEAIPAIEKSKSEGNDNPRVIIELPNELVVSSKGNNRVEISNLNELKEEVEMLRFFHKK